MISCAVLDVYLLDVAYILQLCTKKKEKEAIQGGEVCITLKVLQDCLVCLSGGIVSILENGASQTLSMSAQKIL